MGPWAVGGMGVGDETQTTDREIHQSVQETPAGGTTLFHVSPLIRHLAEMLSFSAKNKIHRVERMKKQNHWFFFSPLSHKVSKSFSNFSQFKKPIFQIHKI